MLNTKNNERRNNTRQNNNQMKMNEKYVENVKLFLVNEEKLQKQKINQINQK